MSGDRPIIGSAVQPADKNSGNIFTLDMRFFSNFTLDMVSISK
jgi:hypothetical protein